MIAFLDAVSNAVKLAAVVFAFFTNVPSAVGRTSLYTVPPLITPVFPDATEPLVFTLNWVPLKDKPLPAVYLVSLSAKVTVLVVPSPFVRVRVDPLAETPFIAFLEAVSSAVRLAAVVFVFFTNVPSAVGRTSL